MTFVYQVLSCCSELHLGRSYEVLGMLGLCWDQLPPLSGSLEIFPLIGGLVGSCYLLWGMATEDMVLSLDSPEWHEMGDGYCSFPMGPSHVKACEDFCPVGWR